MKKLFQVLRFVLFCSPISISVLAQPAIVEPGHRNINPTLLNTGKFTWSTTSVDEDLFVTVEQNSSEIIIVRREIRKGLEKSNHTIILNAKTFEPKSESYKGEEVLYNLQYGTRLKGMRTIFETNEKENLNELITGKYFNKESLPFVISTLPLSLGYRAILPVINFTSSFKSEYLRYWITDVSEVKSFSCFTGIHDLWKVTVTEKNRNIEFTLYIDKATRRIRREHHGGESIYNKIAAYADLETEFSPIKAVFNAKETQAMLSGGTASIKGQAYTTSGAPKSLLQRSKKEYAKKGSLVCLIPNSEYFREWIDYNLNKQAGILKSYTGNELNLSLERGQKCIYPLPEEIKKYHILTDVVDDKGNFVFQNLKPGEYLVFVSFVADKYSHTTKTPNGSFSVTVNPDGTGYAAENVDITHWAKAQNILNFEFVKITREGEIVNVNLK